MSSSEIYHYGTPRHSGRYPWGSGKNPQRNQHFRQRVRELRKQGLTEAEIAKALDLSLNQYRTMNTISKNEEKKELVDNILKLHDKQWSNTAIAEKFGVTEGTVRNYISRGYQYKETAVDNTARALAAEIENKPYLDVGKGVEAQLGVTKTNLDNAVALLETRGYRAVPIHIPQAENPQNHTTTMVLVKDDGTKTDAELIRDVWANRAKLTSPYGFYFEDNGEVKRTIQPPVSIDSKRIMVNYAETGGDAKDGVIELRQGVPDLSLGDNRYAQVRIAVDGSHYLKGMAMYADDLPDGIDIRFNTSKHEGTPLLGSKDNSVLKPLKKDGATGEISDDNPFGAVVRQRDYIDSDGTKKQSPINIVNDDTDWAKWSKSLSSQFLSKQYPAVAKKQLALKYDEMEQEFKEISELTNPTVKRKLLESFADDCDSASVHLKAKAFPGQATHVILPLTSIKDDEVYAPNYKTGEEVVLVRFPHQGVFEIPRLTVNNDNKEGKSLLGNAAHAVGISAQTAKQLSGADFDGDTVVVIPTAGQKIRTEKAINSLVEFTDTMHDRYHKTQDQIPTGNKPGQDGFNKGLEMGKISNLITDMTLKGAPTDQVIRAVKQAQVVIDAEKHNLDWKRSARELNIAQLKELYQGGANKGASTIVSKASADEHILERKEIKFTSKMTPEERARWERGEKIYRDTNEYKMERVQIKDPGQMTERELAKYNKGQKVYRYTGNKTAEPVLQKVSKMEATDDAYSLAGNNLMEHIYADHANKLKALANEARKELRTTGKLQVNPAAKQTFKEQVSSLLAQLNEAKKNLPLERQAQAIADTNIKAKMAANPDWEKDDIKKQRAIAIRNARLKVQTVRRKKLMISITPKEWEAIQAGAISDATLDEILRFTDMDVVRQYATPRRARPAVSTSARARARSLLNQGRSQAEVAEAIGVSVSTLLKALNEDS